MRLMNDIKEYLKKFSNVVNQISVIDRSFLEREILNPILCATSLVGLHVSGPFSRLLFDNETTYSVLMECFPKLYNELISVQAGKLITSEHVLKFTSEDHHKKSLPKQCLVDSIVNCANLFRHEVLQLLNIMLPKLAEGFANQRGAIFGFGPCSEQDTGTVLKISKAEERKRQKLEKAPVHNLKEEKSVGEINYELHIRGKEHLEAVSRKLVLNKNMDVLDKANQTKIKLKTFKKPAEDIKNWNKKLKQHEEAGYQHQEFLN